MSAVAAAAGVATGTAYVHYESKDELVYATYMEVKAGLSAAVIAGMDTSESPFEQWSHMLKTAYRFLSEEPERARFLSQLEESPYFDQALARLAAAGDPLGEASRSETFARLLVDLPDQVVYALSIGVAVRLIAAGIYLEERELETLVAATWRAVTRP